MAVTIYENVTIYHGTYYNRSRDYFVTDKRPPKILARPLSISLRVGCYCNLSCSVCLSDSGPQRSYERVAFAPLLESLSELVPLRVVWTGGEPLLYDIEDELEQSIEVGFFNVVTTNLTSKDPFRKLAQKIFYDVSIYGWDRQSYSLFTGRDCFDRVEKNLHGLFDAGHLVGVSIRVDANWRNYLPRLLDYVSQFPVRKLLLLNTLLVGRISPESYPPLSDEMCMELEAFFESSQFAFSTILPYVASLSDDSPPGYILVTKPSNIRNVFFVNGVPCSSAFEVIQEIHRNSRRNFRLFTLQKYSLGLANSQRGNVQTVA